jgi:AI-2 transport protein TqsA
MPEPSPGRTTNKLLLTIVVFLALAALKLASTVVIALLLTVLLVYLIDPLVVLLHRRRMPLWLAATIAVVVFAAVFAGFGTLVFLDMPHFARSFPRFQEQIVARAQLIVSNLERSLGIAFIVDPFEEISSAPLRPLLLNMARGSLRFVSEFSLIFFFAIILLLGKYRVIRLLLTVFPRRHSLVPVMLKHIDLHMRAFLGIKALASLVIGIGTALILVAFKVEFAVTWGFLTVILNFVPTLGPLTAIALPALISLVQYPGWLMTAAVVLSLAALHVGISNFIEPRLIGERLDLSFFVIFLSLFFWGWMWGAPGILLAVPVTATLKIILERIPATANMARLLGKVRRRREYRSWLRGARRR